MASFFFSQGIQEMHELSKLFLVTISGTFWRGNKTEYVGRETKMIEQDMYQGDPNSYPNIIWRSWPQNDVAQCQICLQ